MSRDRYKSRDDYEAEQAEYDAETAEPAPRTKKDPEVIYRRKRFT